MRLKRLENLEKHFTPPNKKEGRRRTEKEKKKENKPRQREKKRKEKKKKKKKKKKRKREERGRNKGEIWKKSVSRHELCDRTPNGFFFLRCLDPGS